MGKKKYHKKDNQNNSVKFYKLLIEKHKHRNRYLKTVPPVVIINVNSNYLRIIMFVLNMLSKRNCTDNYK